MINYFTNLWSFIRHENILIYITLDDITSISFNQIVLSLLIAFIVGMIALRLGRDLYR